MSNALSNQERIRMANDRKMDLESSNCIDYSERIEILDEIELLLNFAIKVRFDANTECVVRI